MACCGHFFWLDYGGCSEYTAFVFSNLQPPTRQGACKGAANRPGQDRIHARVCSGIWDRGIEIRRSGDGGRTGTAVSFLNRGASPMPPWAHVQRVEPCTCGSDQLKYMYSTYIHPAGGYIQSRDPAAPVTQVLGVGGGAAMGAETPARLKS